MRVRVRFAEGQVSTADASKQLQTGHGANSASLSECTGLKKLNEAEQSRMKLHNFRMAIYLHVDDSLVLGCGAGATLGLLTMDISENMEAAGFRVPERRRGADVQKVVGFQLGMDTGIFSFPPNRHICVRLYWMMRMSGVWTKTFSVLC